MDGAFDRDTAVAAVGDGRWRATVDDSWGTGHSPNGGFLAAVAARAAAAAAGRPDPLSVTAHFLRATAPGDVDVDVEVVRRGRALATVAARLHQDGAERLRLLAAVGDLAPPAAGDPAAGAPAAVAPAAGGPVAGDVPARGAPAVGPGGGAGVGRVPPPLAALEDCVPGHPDLHGGVPVPLGRHLDLRFDPAAVGWSQGRPSGRGELAAWVRFADGRPPDPYALLFVVDALPPSAYDLGVRGWVPTVELTVHVHARPVPGWLRLWLRTTVRAGGYLEEDAEVWDADDRLVATARQMAMCRNTQLVHIVLP
jgi:hypothetical protein